jgi:membrane-associated phospholipid phosphatase
MTMVEVRSLSSNRRRRAGGSRSRRASPSPLVLPGAVALAAVLSAAVIGRLVDTGNTRGLDHSCRRRMRRVRSNPLSRAAAIAAGLGEPIVQVPLSILASIAVARRSPVPAIRGRASPYHARNWVTSASPLLASVAAILAHHGIKLVFRRRRPPGAWLHGNTEPSFPSGHVSIVTATACASAYSLVRRGVHPAKVIPVTVLVPCSVGLSRVYLDKHWASDVIGGFLVGLGIAAGSVVVGEAVRAPVDRRLEVSAS